MMSHHCGPQGGALNLVQQHVLLTGGHFAVPSRWLPGCSHVQNSGMYARETATTVTVCSLAGYDKQLVGPLRA